MVVAPMLNGGRIENRWQPMSAAMWCGPSSFSTSFIAAKIGRSGQPVQKPGGRGGTASASALTRGSSAIAGRFGARSASAKTPGAAALTKARTPLSMTSGMFPGHRQYVLAVEAGVMSYAQDVCTCSISSSSFK